ncbi:MAG: acyl-CoA thioesterase [Marinilabiliales bacterium]|nr:MAG: acyl-CoA thioesterase [Marinilabiliales bacterium]
MSTNDQSTPAHVFLHFAPIQIRFNDIDIMGHVNNSVFQHYFDYARLQYFRHVLGRHLSWEKETLILASISVDYHCPVHINDRIEVATGTVMLGNKSIHMVQEVRDTESGNVMASSRCILVAFDAAMNCSIPLPGEWRQSVMSFEKEVSLKYG